MIVTVDINSWLSRTWNSSLIVNSDRIWWIWYPDIMSKLCHLQNSLFAVSKIYVVMIYTQSVLEALVIATTRRTTNPSNTRRWNNAGLLLGHSLRRSGNINPALVQRLAFAGNRLGHSVGLMLKHRPRRCPIRHFSCKESLYRV